MVNKVRFSTRELLSEVSLRLIKYEKKEAMAASKNLPVSEFQSYFTEAAVGLGNRIPNETSRLFTAMQGVMFKAFGCHPKQQPPVENCCWPCEVNYLNEIHEFLYEGYDMEFSIMVENNEELQSDKYYYLLFSFPPDAHVYTVIDISQKFVPELGVENEITNIFRFRELYFVTGKIMTKFCEAVVIQYDMDKEFHSRDLSTYGVRPNLYVGNESDPDQPPKKRRKKVEDQPLSETYVGLKAKFKSDVVHSKQAILFGAIHHLIVRYFSCRSDVNPNEWPGGPNYNSNIFKLWIPSKQVKNNETQLNVFNVSIIKSPKNYFLNIRSFDTNKVCTQKVIDDLIPTFQPEDVKVDDKRAQQLHFFVMAIIEKFICKVLKGTYKSIFSASEGNSEGGSSRSRNESCSGSIQESEADLI